MPQLQHLLYGVALQTVAGPPDRAVRTVQFDSRRVGPDDLFVATRGVATDGHRYIDQAVAAGAGAVVCEELPAAPDPNVTYAVVPDSREALGLIATRFYGQPSERLRLVGVTGTNGKTTVTTLLYHLFRGLGYAVGLISTVQNEINGRVVPATHTTPDALAINALLAEMADAGCTHVFMEVSSHAADQRRIAGLRFAGALFTNITHDHLDYHGTFEAYIKAKKLFFDGLPPTAFALTNADDRRGSVMVQNCRGTAHTFALKNPADFKARLLGSSLQGLELELNGQSVWFRLIGHFNAYNLLAVYGAAVLLDEAPDEVLRVLSGLPAAPGRFEQMSLPGGVTAVVDYAHTPDALENVLTTIEGLRTGEEQVITVVGCGGNRDRAKRPEMARIAAAHSDRVVLTSDNPRDEDPAAIIEEMRGGIGPAEAGRVLTVVDRREALQKAAALARPGDILLVTGKGHETYQEVRGQRHPFDDRRVLTEIFASKA